MRILVYEWKAYLYKDILFQLEQLGHRIEQVEQVMKTYDEDEAFTQYLTKRIEEVQPDLLFTINYFAVISTVCQQKQIPYLVWNCDCPLISMYHQSIYHSCNFIFTFDQADYLEWKDKGVKHCYYLPLAVDTNRLDYVIEHGQSFPYQSDISFVGSLYEQNSYDALKHKLPLYLQGYFDGVIEAQKNISGGNIIEKMLTPDILLQLEEYFQLKKSKDSFSDLGLVFSTTVLGFKTAEIIRREALLALSKRYQVMVYSNSDIKEMKQIRYGGGLDYFSEMPLAFYASKINLNFTIPNIKSGLPLRVWDVLGCGGFLMTNYQAEIPRYFEIGKDLVCFEDVDELVEKAGYYLTHEEERISIAKSGKEKVKKIGVYKERLNTMLNTIEENWKKE